jgi:membrane peptidoglycan carboxypeptidase
MPAESRAANALWLWLWGPLLVAVVVVAFLGGMASAPIALPEPIQAQPATLVDDTGRTVSTVQPPAPAEQLPIDQVPDILLRSVVATQDPGYFSRHGVAVTDLLAAAAADLVRVRRHGTTIEERYARQVQVAAGSVVPSLRESTVAARLSQHLSPRALLTRYVNGMYFGNGVYGVAAASRFYFDVPVTQLGIPQTAMLVGIAADPSRSNPVAAPGRALAAEQQALAAMRRANVITAEQAQAAAGVRLEIRPHRQLDRPSAAPDLRAVVVCVVI